MIASSTRVLKRAGVEMRPRAIGASDHIVTFTDGTDLAVEAVIWATGFESITPGSSWRSRTRRA